MRSEPVIKILIILFLFSPIFLRAGEPEKPPSAPSALVIFGATGDLSSRKLFPALYNLALEGDLPQNIEIVGVASKARTDQEFRILAGKAVDQFSRTKPKMEAVWDRVASQMTYVQGSDEGYETLKKRLSKIEPNRQTYYLAVHPDYFPVIVEKLRKSGLAEKGSRIVLEKPFGTDLDSALKLQEKLERHLEEDQIYRVDHYLGKEGVQNILNFRLKNGLFESIWNRDHIDHVQITLGEEIGVGTRAHFWEATGLLRDVFQNHLMQLFALVAMDLPKEETIQAEKAKVLKTARYESAVRGQYEAGKIKDSEVAGYRQENGVPETSSVETFAAAKIFVENERWKGVPFFIRGGKRLPKQTTEIALVFKTTSPDQVPDALFIRVQPEPGIYFRCDSEIYDLGYHVAHPVEAYEKILAGAIQADKSLFVNAEEQMAAWRLLTPLLSEWKNPPIALYPAGTWGPAASDELLAEKGRKWELFFSQKPP